LTLPEQIHKITMPDNSIAILYIIEKGLLIKRPYYSDFDLSRCSASYANLALRELGKILLQKIGKRPVLIGIHLPQI